MKITRVFIEASLVVFNLSFVYAADTIKVTVVTDNGPATQFVFESGKPFVLDELRNEKYIGFVGCQGIDTSSIKDQVIVGRYIAIQTNPVSNNSVGVRINYLASKLNGIKPHEIGKDCVINNSNVSSFETTPSTFLKRGTPQAIDLMTVPNIHKIELLLE